jgi:hypothetical protein
VRAGRANAWEPSGPHAHLATGDPTHGGEYLHLALEKTGRLGMIPDAHSVQNRLDDLRTP